MEINTEQPEIIPELFIIVPLLFILMAFFTNIRYDLRPNDYIGHSTVFASLVIGFIFLYGMQKYDKMDANVPVVERNIIFLQEIAVKYDPSLTCLLIQYLVNFLNFTNDEFPILTFEKEVLPLIDNEEATFRVRESVSLLETISYERITKANLISPVIWILVFIISLLLTVIFPMDSEFEKPIDSLIVIILIWLPIAVIYYLYRSELNTLDNTMRNLIQKLNYSAKSQGVKCKFTEKNYYREK